MNNRDRLITVGLLAALVLVITWNVWPNFWSNLWPKTTPPPAKATNVPKKAPVVNKPSLEQRVTRLERDVAAHKERITKLEKQVAAPAAPAPAAPLPTPQVGTTPTSPSASVGVVPKPSNDGWRPVLTDGRTLRLGTSTVPPPKVPVKGPEGSDR